MSLHVKVFTEKYANINFCDDNLPAKSFIAEIFVTFGSLLIKEILGTQLNLR